MPKRGKLLTLFEMGKIAGLQQCGKSVLEIAEFENFSIFLHTRLPMFFSDRKFEGVNLDGRWYLKYDLLRNYS